MKVARYGEHVFSIHCPACGYEHPFNIGKPNGNGAQWTFNGDFDRPTFAPSMLCVPDGPKRCHSFVENGMIRFLPDSWHGRSDTAPLPDVEE
ncbi:MAG TPA: DUF6527 family protein [Methylocystis sp.]|jgi:hypothetical protein